MKNNPVKEYGTSSGNSIMDALAAKGITPASSKEVRKAGGQTPVAKTTQTVSAEPVTQAVFKLPKIASFRSRSKMVAVDEQAQANEEVIAWEKESIGVIQDSIEFMRVQRAALPNLPASRRELYLDDEEDFVDNFIGKSLMEENAGFRRFLVVAFAQAMVATCPALRSEITWTVDMLVEAGFFTKSGHDGKKIYDVAVDITSEYRDHRDARKTANDLLGLVDKAREAGRQLAETADKMIEQAAGPIESRLTASQLGVNDGLGLIVDPGWEDQDSRFHRGGKLLIRSTTDGYLSLLQATNGVRRIAEAAVERNIVISINEINNGRVRDAGSMDPELRKANFKVLMTLKRALEFSEHLEAIAEKHKQFQWEADIERVELTALATLTAEQFYAGAIGTYLVDPLGHRPFLVPKIENGKPAVDKVKSQKYRKTIFVMEPASKEAYDVFFLAGRTTVGGEIITQYPDRLTKFFTDFPQAIDKLIKADRNRIEKAGSVSKEARDEQKAAEFDKNFEAQMLEAAEETAVVEEATTTEAEASEAPAEVKKTSRKKRSSKTKTVETEN